MEAKKKEQQCCHAHHHEHEHHHEHGSHAHGHEHQHDHDHGELGGWAGIVVGAVMLAVGLALNYIDVAWFQRVQFWYYAVAVLVVGWPVMKEAAESAHHGDVFSEFMLMTVAALGALFIGEYPEAVAVLLLYCIGEALQDRAVDKARRNIESLVAIMPAVARVVKADGTYEEMSPKLVKIGDFIEVRPGERVPLDGLIDDTHSARNDQSSAPAFNTAALTGESMPRTIENGQEVMAGMIAYDQVVRLRVVREEQESAVMRILHMVQDATERKSPSELFIRRFARVYTPIVILLAVLTVVLPWLWSLVSPSAGYVFSEWLHRALVFLVISCPCALVISIPLSYFAGIGAASRVGILFKGSNYLDAIADVDTLVFDKTGTLTTGEFQVKEVVGLSDDDLLTVIRIEQSSNHPIAKAIVKLPLNADKPQLADADIQITNRAGYGLEATVGTDEWFVGTLRLLDDHSVSYPESLKAEPYTFVACSKNGHFIGQILLSDTLKDDAREAVKVQGSRFKVQGSKFKVQGSKGVQDIRFKTVVLSGDKQALVSAVAQELGADEAHGDLLPEDKLAFIERMQAEGRRVAFVGDGINDAPVLAMSDVGVAMGALGSDMAVETADVVIQTDQPSKVLTAISVGRRTRRLVKQNVVLALGVKAAVMLLGLFGVATLWEAVFADSGVALLAVLNAMRGATIRR